MSQVKRAPGIGLKPSTLLPMALCKSIQTPGGGVELWCVIKKTAAMTTTAMSTNAAVTCISEYPPRSTTGSLSLPCSVVCEEYVFQAGASFGFEKIAIRIRHNKSLSHLMRRRKL